MDRAIHKKLFISVKYHLLLFNYPGTDKKLCGQIIHDNHHENWQEKISDSKLDKFLWRKIWPQNVEQINFQDFPWFEKLFFKHKGMEWAVIGFLLLEMPMEVQVLGFFCI